MRLKVEPRLEVPRWMNLLSTIGAILVALFFGGVLLAYGGLNPLVAYRQMFSIGFLDTYSFSDTLVKATPLVLAGLGVTVAFRMKLWNIGAEGQLFMGAWAASAVALYVLPAETPRPVMLLAMTLAGFAAGAVWGLFPASLRPGCMSTKSLPRSCSPTWPSCSATTSSTAPGHRVGLALPPPSRAVPGFPGCWTWPIRFPSFAA